MSYIQINNEFSEMGKKGERKPTVKRNTSSQLLETFDH